MTSGISETITKEHGSGPPPVAKPRLLSGDTATKQRPLGRPWAPGQSGNPAGRPRGAWSKRTSGVGLGGLMARRGKAVLNACITAALAGDVAAQRLILERLLPRERLIRIELPKVRGPQDALKALAILLDCAAEGSITSAEAANLSAVAQRYIDVSAAQALQERLALIEKRLSETQ